MIECIYSIGIITFIVFVIRIIPYLYGGNLCELNWFSHLVHFLLGFTGWIIFIDYFSIISVDSYVLFGAILFGISSVLSIGLIHILVLLFK